MTSKKLLLDSNPQISTVTGTAHNDSHSQIRACQSEGAAERASMGTQPDCAIEPSDRMSMHAKSNRPKMPLVRRRKLVVLRTCGARFGGSLDIHGGKPFSLSLPFTGDTSVIPHTCDLACPALGPPLPEAENPFAAFIQDNRDRAKK